MKLENLSYTLYIENNVFNKKIHVVINKKSKKMIHIATNNGDCDKEKNADQIKIQRIQNHK